MFLQLNVDGKNGSGTMFGTVEVTLNHGAYHALYRFDNDIEEACVSDEGELTLNVRVLERALVESKGHLPPDLTKLGGSLPGSHRFVITLNPDLHEPGVLRGRHTYEPDIVGVYSEADERYTYAGPALRR
jgi:hypothetical protein